MTREGQSFNSDTGVLTVNSSGGPVGRLRQALSNLLAVSDESTREEYDFEYLQSKDYAHLGTSVEIEDEWYLRCNLCSKLYEPCEVERAFEHIAGHLEMANTEASLFDQPPIQDADPEVV
ncbi:hypothetical protein D320_14900 [Haloferax sp. BAB-2207]|uniref:Uncharacterized protein n=1 Tax=Haloferax lucentense (strain DSM 14919 / JCM 9276 / NCIMB 13854 / Aa 2.2) TaxID=1230452 RepID=M0GYZ7_HALL2|nr:MULTISPECIES: hypothetical protein [Haloferax]ELK51652.1 hypothetical protein D320_14900 [Haloferax sp. BAB-2207]ELZ76069.1 hypothetical protein C456_04555 [Haloferax lucentense DSM 14919]